MMSAGRFGPNAGWDLQIAMPILAVNIPGGVHLLCWPIPQSSRRFGFISAYGVWARALSNRNLSASGDIKAWRDPRNNRTYFHIPHSDTTTSSNLRDTRVKDRKQNLSELMVLNSNDYLKS
jgi:hypothetical protein